MGQEQEAYFQINVNNREYLEPYTCTSRKFGTLITIIKRLIIKIYSAYCKLAFRLISPILNSVYVAVRKPLLHLKNYFLLFLTLPLIQPSLYLSPQLQISNRIDHHSISTSRKL